MIYLYNKVYNNKNLDYIFANAKGFSVVRDGVEITIQPTKEDAIGFRQVMLGAECVKWLEDTFAEPVESTHLFHSLNGILFPNDKETLVEVRFLAKKAVQDAKALIIYDLHTDNDNDEAEDIKNAFLIKNLPENIFYYSQLRDDKNLQQQLIDLLAETMDITLVVTSDKAEIEVGEFVDLNVKCSTLFKIESSANDILQVDANQGKDEPEWQNPLADTNTRINALAEGESTIKITAKNRLTQKVAEVALKAVVTPVPDPLIERVEKLEQGLDATNAKIATLEQKTTALEQKTTENTALIESAKNDILALDKRLTNAEQTITNNKVDTDIKIADLTTRIEVLEAKNI